MPQWGATWEAWAAEIPVVLAYSKVAPYTMTTTFECRTVWDEKAGADKAIAWLEQDNRVPIRVPFVFEAVTE